MNDLRIAAQQALEFIEVTNKSSSFRLVPDSNLNKTITTLRAALAEEEKAAAWLAERKEHWRKEREKAQATKNHDPELSAALGWPGGVSDPVLDRTQLLQMVAELRDARQPAPEPVAWLVMDEGGYVQHAASWRDAAHEHINDAINEHDLVCARTWRVVPAYIASPQRKENSNE